MIRRILREFPAYERSVQFALVSGVALLIMGLIAALFAPVEQRAGILIGLGALVVAIQAAILFANRHLVTAYTAAQRRYLAEDFEGAAALLEAERSAGRADVRSLTLLGSTYRQLARLSESAAVLYEALHKDPQHPFPLYGIGRTLLSDGQFTEALTYLERAAAAGAPSAAWLDVAEAAFYADDRDTVRRALSTAKISSEDAPRLWMAAHLHWRLGLGEPPAKMEAALIYWRAVAARFAATPYGNRLRAELALYSLHDDE